MLFHCLAPAGMMFSTGRSGCVPGKGRGHVQHKVLELQVYLFPACQERIDAQLRLTKLLNNGSRY